MSKLFGDLSNPDLTTPQNIDIAVVTKNVTFSCSSPPCKVQRDILTSSKELLDTIDSIRKEDEGIYSLRRITATGNSYTTASIYLTVTGRILISRCSNIQWRIIHNVSMRTNLTDISLDYNLQIRTCENCIFRFI